MSDSVWPPRWQPTISPVPGILQARTLEWVTISFSNAWKWKVKVKVVQSNLTLRDPIDCSPPGSSVHGIFQARVLQWVAIAFSEGIGYALQYSSLENSMDSIVQGVTKSWTWLSDFHFHFFTLRHKIIIDE